MKTLKFKIGDVVYFASDFSLRTPMQVCQIDLFSQEFDYVVTWLNSQRKAEKMKVKQEMLTQKELSKAVV